MSGEEKVGNSGQKVGTHKKCLKQGNFVQSNTVKVTRRKVGDMTNLAWGMAS